MFLKLYRIIFCQKCWHSFKLSHLLPKFSWILPNLISQWNLEFALDEEDFCICMEFPRMVAKLTRRQGRVSRVSTILQNSWTKEYSRVKWKAKARREPRYFSVVMLNSSLLKAMHVVDSFQNSILADYPELSSQVSQRSLGQFRLWVWDDEICRQSWKLFSHQNEG